MRDDLQPSPLRLATLPRRLGSLVYEILLLAALVLVTGFLLAPLVSPRDALSATLRLPSTVGRLVSLAGIVGATFAYCMLSWTRGRRTLPMKTWHLGLRRTAGGVLDRGSALRRYAACWIGPGLALLAFLPLRGSGFGAVALCCLVVNYAWAVADPDRQFLHDRLAGTCLVDERAA